MKPLDLPQDTLVTIWYLWRRHSYDPKQIAKMTGISESRVKRALKDKPPISGMENRLVSANQPGKTTQAKAQAPHDFD